MTFAVLGYLAGWLKDILKAAWPYLLCLALGAYGWQHFRAGPEEVKLMAALKQDAESAAQFKRDANAITAKHQVEMQRTKETYDASLKRQAHDLADARDTGNRLRDAVAIYAGVGQGLSASEDPAVLRQRLETLGVLLAARTRADEQRAVEADAVNDALAACEATVK